MPSAKVLENKKAVVAELAEQLKTAQSGVLVDYIGLTVEEDTDLRRKLREGGVDYKVVKNTLTRFAAKEVGFDELDEVLNGPTSLALGFEDPVAPAKIIADFAKKNDKISIKAGFLDGKVISLDEIKRLADTPSKETLIATILSSLNAPASNLVRLLQAIVDKGVEPAELAAGNEKAEEAAPAAEVAEATAAEEPAPVAEEAAPAAEEAPAEEAPTEEAQEEAPAAEEKTEE